MNQQNQTEKLSHWVQEVIHAQFSDSLAYVKCEPLFGDASFRRYFRVFCDSKTFIAVFAPPELENMAPFISIANYWQAQNINVPNIIAYDLKNGFLLQSDFGDTQLLTALETANDQTTTAQHFYLQAIQALVDIQAIKNQPLPCYDANLLEREVRLFDEWFLSQLLELNLTSADTAVLKKTYQALIESALAQPIVCVHRDYHSRNLMVTKNHDLGIIDFQDAVVGPITYDLVSLLRDCYISWPDKALQVWIDDYLKLATEKNNLRCNRNEFIRWFDWMGMQRHLKAIGIFSRLNIRDHKSHYLKDIPRTLTYVLSVSANYPELTDFHQWLKNKVEPIYQNRLGAQPKKSIEVSS